MTIVGDEVTHALDTCPVTLITLHHDHPTLSSPHTMGLLLLLLLRSGAECPDFSAYQRRSRCTEAVAAVVAFGAMHTRMLDAPAGAAWSQGRRSTGCVPLLWLLTWVWPGSSSSFNPKSARWCVGGSWRPQVLGSGFSIGGF